jgi:hypothetical protein
MVSTEETRFASPRERTVQGFMGAIQDRQTTQKKYLVGVEYAEDADPYLVVAPGTRGGHVLKWPSHPGWRIDLPP